MRMLYVWLIGLHPRNFRERFGEDMTGIFDEAESRGHRAVLLADALASLIRQRWLRPRSQRAASASVHLAAGPSFQLIDESLPRRSALLNGAILTFLSLSLVVFAIGRNTSFPRMLIGARYPRPHVLPVDRASVAESAATTEVKVARPADDPNKAAADFYFHIVRVLGILDADRDRILSTSEILQAPNALAKLDFDRDGKLSPEECGHHVGQPTRDPERGRRARHNFMRFHPVLYALDANHDAALSAGEIRASVAALMALDRNYDGALDLTEVIPSVR